MLIAVRLAAAWISCFMFFPLHALAQEATREVPRELFGIKVGEVYDIGNPDTGDLGNFPVKSFAGIQRFLGSGISYYFEPLKANPEFEYKEERIKPDEKYYTTSFRAYILPVLPSDITTMEQLRSRWQKVQHRVALIEWQKKMPSEEDAYFRSLDYCKTFAASLNVAPEITDIYDTIGKWYSCKFTSGEREFEIRNAGELLTVGLSLRKDIREKMEKDTETFVRKLKARELLE